MKMAACEARSRLLCRFFTRGFCREESSCPFSHDTDNGIRIPEDVCWYYLRDQCVYNTNCRFRHLEPSNIIALSCPEQQNTSSLPRLVPFTSKSLLSAKPKSYPENGTTSPSHQISDTRQTCKDSGCDENDYSFDQLSCSLSGDSCKKSYAEATGRLETSTAPVQTNSNNTNQFDKDSLLCPFAANDTCQYEQGDCMYLHGDICDLCQRAILHPLNPEQQTAHREECIREHEREMELSFAIQRSADKACGVCMDLIMEKEPPTERRFGILEKCSHIFCLSCIRKWRQTKQFDNRTIRACPECRVPSDFVIPSKYWYDDKDEKQRLIDSYKQALSTKPCKYFKQGNGECPFAGACFYLHAYPDGRKAEMPPPRPRRRQNQEGELETLRDMLLWNYLEVRDDHRWLLTLDLEDVFDLQEMGLFSETDDDSDDDDLSDDFGENLVD